MTKRLTVLLGFIAGWLIGHVAAQKPELAPPPRALTPDAQPLAFPPTSGTYEVLVLGATDGDTVRFAWLLPDSGRLRGINAPEMRAADPRPGQAAKAFLAGKLTAAPMRLTIHGREKYGRALIQLWDADGSLINQQILDAGHARPYLGDP